MAPAVPLLIGATLVSAVVSLVARFRAGTRLERDQVKWIAYATGLLLASFIIDPLVQAAGGPPVPLGLALL
jgi:hypothetical protein